MKRTILAISFCMLAGFTFAQKKAVKEAKSTKDVKEARALITPALTNPETMNDPETWKTAGDIEYKVFDDNLTAEQVKEISGKAGAKFDDMYGSMLNMLDPYIKSDELAELPDAKGKVKNKVRGDISKKIKHTYPQFINAGIYYSDKKDYAKATKFFGKYWEIPSLKLFAGEPTAFNTKDTIFQTIKYYAVISAIQSKDSDLSVSLLKKMISEPYYANSTYKESDPYELLASEYQTSKDSLGYVNILAVGAQKFPKNQYFTPNLINEYIKSGKTADALNFLDQAIANDRSNACDFNSVKGALFTDQKNYTAADAAFNAAFAADANCARALEGIGLLYVLQAQEMKEVANQTTNRKEQLELDKKTQELYSKGLPYLVQFAEIVKNREKKDLYDIRKILSTLQNVYYNLNKHAELEVIDKELAKVREDIDKQ